MSAPRPPSAAGLVAVTATVKGSPAQVRGFVAANLRAGADHVLVFVDDADPAVLAVLASDPQLAGHVTAIGTDADYWGAGRAQREDPAGVPPKRRPGNLNRRQKINANLANTLVSGVPGFAWLFHLDLDERLHLDKQRLLSLSDDVRVTALTTWEAVSGDPREGPSRYKRAPTRDELTALHHRGVIKRPSQRAYFRGHLTKRGVRPDPRLRLRIHSVVKAPTRGRVPAFEAEWLSLLHDESDTFEEFVRKWQALVSSGRIRQKPRRDRLRRTVEPLLTDPSLDPVSRETRLRRVYKHQVADDVSVLEELGLLAVPDPAWSSYAPTALSDTDLQTLRGVAALLGGSSKRAFDRDGPRVEPFLERLLDRQTRRGADPLVLAGLRSALDRASTPPSRPS